MELYDHKKIEKKWQDKWEKNTSYQAQEDSKKKKLYILDMFPYPSGDGLHVGHVEAYTATEIYSRFKRMEGYNVLHPMGWDAFGLPAENYAIKTGVHPAKTTKKASDNFRQQIKNMGLSYDWSREIGTHTPKYYKWTQWFFLLLYKNKLAYKALAKVNWCDSCKTVLANEQVEGGHCERCKNEVIQKDLKQWFFKITDFADQLIDDLEKVDWPKSTVLNQRNWIGRSEGAEIKFPISNSQFSIEVFTTRPDTLFGATYMVLAPEHTLVKKLKGQITNWKEVVKYIEQTKEKTEIERTAEGKEKTGVKLEGVTAINPANQGKIPVFIADYVLEQYGTGAIMAVPAHDDRDFEFAEKYELPVREVISGGNIKEAAYIDDGQVINSGEFNGLDSEEAKGKITKKVGGEMTRTYKLRDWLISRQRYWGAPIPIVYDPTGKPHPVPEEYLPWLLPTDVGFKPTGVSPLADSEELLKRTEDIFGKGWKPEVDTMDTFVCSSWYFFRFADPHNKKEFASKKQIKKWLPVDLYMGGAEHTVLHLMYARFFTKVLHKLGFIDFNEPFPKLRHQGIVLAEDGKKMSKSLGNVVNPDDIVELYGADTIRMYEMFMGHLEDVKSWQTQNIIGVRRFIERVWKLQESVKKDSNISESTKVLLHKTIKKVGSDIENLKFNTAISQMMIFINEMEKMDTISTDLWKSFLLLLAPFAPHITEELWEKIGEKSSIHDKSWPVYVEALTVEKMMTIVVQVNGKVRGEIEMERECKKEEVKISAQELPQIEKWIGDKKISKVIYVPERLINFVTQ